MRSDLLSLRPLHITEPSDCAKTHHLLVEKLGFDNPKMYSYFGNL